MVGMVVVRGWEGTWGWFWTARMAFGVLVGAYAGLVLGAVCLLSAHFGLLGCWWVPMLGWCWELFAYSPLILGFWGAGGCLCWAGVGSCLLTLRSFWAFGVLVGAYAGLVLGAVCLLSAHFGLLGCWWVPMLGWCWELFAYSPLILGFKWGRLELGCGGMVGVVGPYPVCVGCRFRFSGAATAPADHAPWDPQHVQSTTRVACLESDARFPLSTTCLAYVL